MNSYDEIIAALKRFAEEAKKRPLTLGEAIDSLDQAAYALIALILVLPFLQPVPMGPLTVVGGLTFAVLGWQMWQGHDSPVLPEKIRAIVMTEKTWSILATICLKIIVFLCKFTKPRLAVLVDGKRGHSVGAFILITGGLLMAIPFGVLPMNNILPGLAILFYCLALFEQDGLMVLIAFAWLGITIIYFGLFFFLLAYFGKEALTYFDLVRYF